MQAQFLTPLFVVAVSLAASAQVHAQPLSPHADSIEATVDNADLVFVATIEKFDFKVPARDRPGYNSTIVIEETLKISYLQEEDYQGMSMFLPYPAEDLEDWQKRRARLLILYDDYHPDACNVIELVPGKMEIMTADFKLLRNPEQVIKAARETVLRMPLAIKRINTVRLSVPRKIVEETEWEPYYDTGGHLVLTVSADKRLEKRALTYIRSESYMNRYEGVKALRYFKSSKNIALLKSLFKDPGVTLSYYPGPGKELGTETKDYAVRAVVHQILKSWKVDVEKPVIRTKVKK